MRLYATRHSLHVGQAHLLVELKLTTIMNQYQNYKLIVAKSTLKFKIKMNCESILELELKSKLLVNKH